MSDDITLRLQPGMVDTDFIAKIEVTPEYADELKSLMSEHGLEPSDYFQKDLGLGLALIAVVGASAKALAPVLRDFYHRHDGKSIKTVVNGEPFEVRGYSVGQFERIAKALDERKKAEEVEWRASEEALDREMNSD